MKLSIITVNLNNIDGLQKTIDSVISQTFKDFEWIVIDGGSTDGSKELIEKYSNYISYWVSEPDKGIYNAMNKGIKVAKGEYLNFMNSGDCFHSSYVLEDLFSLHYSDDIIVGNVQRMDNNHLLRYHNCNLLKQLLDDTLNHQGAFIKKNILLKYQYKEDYKIISDWIFWIQALLLDTYSCRYTDLIIANQDMCGISTRDHKGKINKERTKYMNSENVLCSKNIYNLATLTDGPHFQSLMYLQAKWPHIYIWTSRMIRLIACFFKCFD